MLGALAVVGCNSSVELPEQPASAPPAVTVETPPAATPSAPPAKPANSTSIAGGGYGGAIAGAHRHVEDTAAKIQFIKAIDLDYATYAKYPKSHEEFMKRVWEPLQTPLPEIEEGYRWEYNPEDHTVHAVLIEEEVTPATNP
jgi:hypothetical protein